MLTRAAMTNTRSVNLSTLNVLVEDLGVGAVLAQPEHGPWTLFLSPQQTSDAACEAVHAVVPDAHPDQVRQLVRRYLPSAPVSLTTSPPLLQPEPIADRRRFPWHVPAVAFALSVLLAAAVGAGVVVGGRVGDELADEPFEAPLFTSLRASQFMECDIIEDLSAVCTVQGDVFTAAAWLGAHDVVSYSFAAGDDTLHLRSFRDAAAATAWTDSDGTQNERENLTQLGSYVLWGNDPGLVDRTAKAMRDADTPGVGSVQRDF
jgi:hypothetical protein